jgi:hypothetical protein
MAVDASMPFSSLAHLRLVQTLSCLIKGAQDRCGDYDELWKLAAARRCRVRLDGLSARVFEPAREALGGSCPHAR